MMIRAKLVVCLAVVFLGGCATVAPPYQPSMENVQSLKAAGPVKVGTFVAGGADKAKIDALTIRGGAFNSPYKGSYAEYLREGLRLELSMAGVLDDRSGTEISGVLLKNEIDASGTSVAHAAMQAQMVVRKNGQVRYDKTKSVRHDWESAFAAMTAVPKAHQNYQITVQKLLGSFYSDNDFQRALK